MSIGTKREYNMGHLGLGHKLELNLGIWLSFQVST